MTASSGIAKNANTNGVKIVNSLQSPASSDIMKSHAKEAQNNEVSHYKRPFEYEAVFDGFFVFALEAQRTGQLGSNEEVAGSNPAEGAKSVKKYYNELQE